MYYSFFSVFIFIVAGLLAYFYHRSSLQARRAGSPVRRSDDLLDRQSGAQLSGMAQARQASEHRLQGAGSRRRCTGLKLRQLLSPVQPSRLAVVRRFGEHERQFPNENENTSTRLGTVLLIGLLGMLAQFFRPSGVSPRPRAAAADARELPARDRRRTRGDLQYARRALISVPITESWYSLHSSSSSTWPPSSTAVRRGLT